MSYLLLLRISLTLSIKFIINRVDYQFIFIYLSPIKTDISLILQFLPGKYAVDHLLDKYI